MDVRFDGKRALVTGAGKGIGRGIAIALHQGGAETIALSRTQEDLDSLSQECPGIKTVFYDVAEDWDKTGRIIESFGAIDLLVNNAGVGIGDTHIFDVTEEQWDDVYNINTKALFRISQVVCKGMVERGKGGSIVNISSASSLRTTGRRCVYGSSKAAVDSITRSFANEFGKHQIRVNSVNPGVVLTKLSRVSYDKKERRDWWLSRVPQNKFGEIEDVVHPVLYLLSDKSSMINGTTITVEGGFLTT